MKIEFEIGDIVFSPYYNFKGKITKIGDVYITLVDKKGDVCGTKVRTKSANRDIPYYLQMVLKNND